MHLRYSLAIASIALSCFSSGICAQSPSPNSRPGSGVTRSATSGMPEDERVWTDLIDSSGPVGISNAGAGVTLCGDVQISEQPGKLSASPGSGVVAVVSKASSRTASNLISGQSFGDCEVYLEFAIAANSNSGVKLEKRYEIQIYDSYGRENPSAKDCSGIYPHWKFRSDGKGLNYLDEGVPPKVNATKPAGEWQTLRIVFKAPRFDKDGNKTRNARFDVVALNGKTIHQDVELDSPTGNAETPLPEVPQAPILLQLDHGPVAFRNVRVRPL